MRAEHVLTRNGEENEWSEHHFSIKEGPGGTTTMSRVETNYQTALWIFRGFLNDGLVDRSPNGTLRSGVMQRTLAAAVVRNLALNWQAKSHKVVLLYLVQSTSNLISFGAHKPDHPGMPRPFVQALTGYLNPDIFPPEKRDPYIEERIRLQLKVLGIPHNENRIEEWKPPADQ